MGTITGLFIAIEGTDGVGKTAFISKLKDIFKDDCVVLHPIHDSDASVLSNSVYEKEQNEVTILNTILLHHRLFYTKIVSALNSNKLVILDRSIISTYVYQEHPSINKYPLDLFKYLLPSIILYAYGRPEQILERLSKRKDNDDLDNLSLETIKYRLDRYNKYLSNLTGVYRLNLFTEPYSSNISNSYIVNLIKSQIYG